MLKKNLLALLLGGWCIAADASPVNPDAMPAAIPKDQLIDVARTLRTVKNARLEPLVAGPMASCQKAPKLSDILLLGEVVDYALCNSPLTRGAWANIRAQAANVALAKTAYLPSLTLSAERGKRNTRSTVRPHDLDEQQQAYLEQGGSLQTKYEVPANTTTYSGQLAWLLIDGGGRRAGVQNSQYLLEAASAASDQTIQEVFYNAVKAYYTAQTAEATYRTAVESAMLAKVAYNAAEARYKLGVGALADKLQAGTAYKQGQLRASQAEGDYKIAMGTLFATMGIQPVQEYVLPTISVSMTDVLPESGSVMQMINVALKNNPRINQAKAEVLAADASIRANRAAYYPKISAVSNWSRSNLSNSYNGQLGNNFEARSNVLSWGIQLTANPFDALATRYRVRSAMAQRDVKQANAEQAEKSVALEVWQSYQEAEKSRKAVSLTQELVRNARQNYEVANGRYKAGVGGILELLTAQNELASSRQEEINNYALWKASTVRLAASMGLLDEMTHIVKPAGAEK